MNFSVQFWVVFCIVVCTVTYFAGAYQGYNRGWKDARIRWGRKWVDDGHGTYWPPCGKCGTKLQVVRPGEAICPNCEEVNIDS